MKARVATILSLTGVLVAGSAAALVNTQVLNGSAPASSAKSAQIEEASTSSASSTPTSASAPSPVSVTVPDSSETTQVSATGTQAAYQIGEAGLVTLDTAGDTLRIVAVVPAAGWMVIETEQKDALNIEVKFQTADTIVEFKANLMFGIISTAVESYSASGTSTGGTVDDDDDDRPSNSTGNSTSNTTGNSTDNSIDDDDDSGSGKGQGGGGDDSHDD